jgi:GAF domain-containing protein
METIQQIEKRRRELQYITYFIIYLLALVVFSLFFFIDQLAGLMGALRYNLVLRSFFVALVAAFIFYLARKESQQGRLTAELLGEMENTSGKLALEIRRKEFLSEISHLIANLRDESVLERLFDLTRNFLEAEGGAVVLRNLNSTWKAPLVSYPDDTDKNMVSDIAKLVAKTGQAVLQPDPRFPDHRQMKNMNSIIAVPLRLEGRLYGVIAFWSGDESVIYGENDLSLIELIAREAAGSAFSVRLMQEKKDQFKGVLKLLATASEDRPKPLAPIVAEHAKALAKQLNLPREAVRAVETAAMLKNVGRLTANGAKNGGGGKSATTLRSLKFPKAVTDILGGYEKALAGNGAAASSPLPVGVKVLALSTAYVEAANPKRGRAPSAASILAKLKTRPLFTEELVAALEHVLAAGVNGGARK